MKNEKHHHIASHWTCFKSCTFLLENDHFLSKSYRLFTFPFKTKSFNCNHVQSAKPSCARISEHALHKNLSNCPMVSVPIKKQGEFRDGFWKGFREKMRVSCFVLLDLQPSKTAPSIRSLQDSPLKTGSAVLQLTLRKAAGQERSLSTKANWMDLGAWHMAIPKYKGFLYCILLIKDYIRHW